MCCVCVRTSESSGGSESFLGAANVHAVSECFSCTATPLRTGTPSSPVSLRKPLPSLIASSSLSFWMRIETVPIGFDPPPNTPPLQHIASPSKGPTLLAICCLFPSVLSPLHPLVLKRDRYEYHAGIFPYLGLQLFACIFAGYRSCVSSGRSVEVSHELPLRHFLFI